MLSCRVLSFAVRCVELNGPTTFHWLTFYHMTPLRIKPSLAATPISEHVSFSDEGPLLETLEFFEISHGSYQSFNFLPYLFISVNCPFKSMCCLDS